MKTMLPREPHERRLEPRRQGSWAVVRLSACVYALVHSGALSVLGWIAIVRNVAGQSTTLRINRLDGERLVLDGLGLGLESSSSTTLVRSAPAPTTRLRDGAKQAGSQRPISKPSIAPCARSSHQWWEPILNRELDWLAVLDPSLDLILTGDAKWRAVEGARLTAVGLAAAIGPHRGPSVASKVLHLKRPRFFPVLDDFVAVMLGVNMPDDAPPARRVKIALDLMLHLRAQGRANLDQLQSIQSTLKAEGVDRSLVRILDAIVWFPTPRQVFQTPLARSPLQTRLLSAEPSGRLSERAHAVVRAAAASRP
jgi:Family of unknown function (DUF6308)